MANKRLPSEAPSLEELKECLNGEPPNTGFYDIQDGLIVEFHALCEKYAYGRTCQLAACVEDLWRNPDKADEFKRECEKRRKMMVEAIKVIRANRPEKAPGQRVYPRR